MPFQARKGTVAGAQRICTSTCQGLGTVYLSFFGWRWKYNHLFHMWKQRGVGRTGWTASTAVPHGQVHELKWRVNAQFGQTVQPSKWIRRDRSGGLMLSLIRSKLLCPNLVNRLLLIDWTVYRSRQSLSVLIKLSSIASRGNMLKLLSFNQVIQWSVFGLFFILPSSPPSLVFLLPSGKIAPATRFNWEAQRVNQVNPGWTWVSEEWEDGCLSIGMWNTYMQNSERQHASLKDILRNCPERALDSWGYPPEIWLQHTTLIN